VNSHRLDQGASKKVTKNEKIYLENAKKRRQGGYRKKKAPECQMLFYQKILREL